jgi:hypothetical protein
VVRARTGPCKIFVSVPGPTLNVLSDETLAQGDARQYDQQSLNAVVNDAAACEVWLNGQQQPAGAPGERKSYTVQKTGTGG